MSGDSPARYIDLPTSTSSLSPPPTHPHRRPWRELFSPSSISTPHSYSSAMSRFRRNVCYFRHNYTLLALAIVFLSLLWHPISMIVFIAVFLLWILLFFSRDEAIVVFGLRIDDRMVVVGLGVVTVLALVVTGVGLNVLVGLIVGFLVIGLHSAFRSCDDQFLDDDQVG